MAVHGREHRVAAADVDVVEQQAHPDAAVRRQQQPARQVPAGGVRIPDVVLQVEGPLRGLDQRQARLQGLPAGVEYLEPRLPRMHGGRAGEHLPQRRRPGLNVAPS